MPEPMSLFAGRRSRVFQRYLASAQEVGHG
jgi:hypothetical protein